MINNIIYILEQIVLLKFDDETEILVSNNKVKEWEKSIINKLTKIM